MEIPLQKGTILKREISSSNHLLSGAMVVFSDSMYFVCVCVCRYYVHVSFISSSNLKVRSVVINCYSPSKYLLNPQLKEDETRSQIHPIEHVKMEG